MRVGDYVRTDKGLIGKIIKKEEYSTHYILKYEGQYCKRVLSTSGTDSEVIKSSSNIIDLIEVGDVVHSKKDNQWWTIQEHQGGNDSLWLQTEWQIIEKNNLHEEIDAIITKEQMKQMEYKIN